MKGLLEGGEKRIRLQVSGRDDGVGREDQDAGAWQGYWRIGRGIKGCSLVAGMLEVGERKIGCR